MDDHRLCSKPRERSRCLRQGFDSCGTPKGQAVAVIGRNGSMIQQAFPSMSKGNMHAEFDVLA
eukprot:125497-Prorocentrum_lima.AAC.1